MLNCDWIVRNAATCLVSCKFEMTYFELSKSYISFSCKLAVNKMSYVELYLLPVYLTLGLG